MPQEHYPAKIFAELFAPDSASGRRTRRRGGGLRVSTQDAQRLGLAAASSRQDATASEESPRGRGKRADRGGSDPFDPQERLAQALRERMGEQVVRTEVTDLIAGRRYRADIVIEHARLVIEFDGFAYHRSKAAFQKDRKRQNAFTQAGWHTLRFFHAQVRNDLEDVVSQVEAFVQTHATASAAGEGQDRDG